MVRAKSGMSIRAAMSAAPTKKLTSSAPQAGVRRSAPRGTSGASARRRCTTKPTAATADAEQEPRAPGRRRPGPGVGGGEGQDHAGEGERQQQRADAGRPRGARATQPRTSTSGRRARSGTGPTSSTAATIATTPIGVSQRPSPANGMNAWPQVRSRSSGGGRTSTSAPRDQGERAAGRQAERVGRRPGPGADRAPSPASRRMAAARTRPTARLIAKIARQSATASTTRAEQRPEHAADLLDRGDDAERHAAPLGGVEVGDQRQRGRHQPAAADALEEAAGDHATAGRRPAR